MEVSLIILNDNDQQMGIIQFRNLDNVTLNSPPPPSSSFSSAYLSLSLFPSLSALSPVLLAPTCPHFSNRHGRLRLPLPILCIRLPFHVALGQHAD